MHIVSIYVWKTSLEKCYVYVQDRNKCLNRPPFMQYDPILIFNISGTDIKQFKYFHTAFS